MAVNKPTIGIICISSIWLSMKGKLSWDEHFPLHWLSMFEISEQYHIFERNSSFFLFYWYNLYTIDMYLQLVVYF